MIDTRAAQCVYCKKELTENLTMYVLAGRAHVACVRAKYPYSFQLTPPPLPVTELDASDLIDDEDMVNNPPHYKSGGMESIDIIEAFKLPFHLGNVIKYVLRHNKKGNALEDLKKSRWYLDRYISHLEKT